MKFTPATSAEPITTAEDMLRNWIPVVLWAKVLPVPECGAGDRLKAIRAIIDDYRLGAVVPMETLLRFHRHIPSP
jgi:hypothetical protein